MNPMALDLSPDQRRALGLALDETVRVRAQGGWRDPVSRGWAAAPAADQGVGAAWAAEVRMMQTQGDLQVPPWPELGGKPPLRVQPFAAAAGDGRVLGFALDRVVGLLLAVWGDAHVDASGGSADEIPILSAARPALARLATPAGDVFVRSGGYTLDVYRREPDPGDPVPPPALVLPGRRMENWLVRASAALASSPSELDRLTALGLLARLSLPGQEEGRALLEGGEGAGVRPKLARWLDGVPGDRRESWQGLALDRVDDLEDEIEEGLDALAGGAGLPGSWPLSVALWRDDLESVRFALAAGSPRRDASPLGEALRDLDLLVSVRAPSLSGVWPSQDHPRLRAVAWQEPGAWWGSLAADAR